MGLRGSLLGEAAGRQVRFRRMMAGLRPDPGSSSWSWLRPVLSLAGHGLRARWRGWAALALLTAIAGGSVLAAVAGAVRTGTAYPRFLAWSNASDVLIAPAGSGFTGYFRAIADMPQVAASATVAGLNVEPLFADGTVDNVANVQAVVDGGFGRLVDGAKMLAGRQPDAGSAGEVMVDQIAARSLGLRAGSALRLGALPDPAQSPGDMRPQRVLTVRVVGVMVTRGSVMPVTSQDRAPTIVGSVALFRELGGSYLSYNGVAVRLRPGASSAAFIAQARSLAARFRDTGGQVFVADETVQAATIERAIRPQAVALALFAAALALCAILIVGQVAGRVLRSAAADNGTLATLGLSRGQLLATGLAQVAVAATAGGALAVVVAVLASPLTPIGPARLAEPAPGMVTDPLVLGAGFAVIVAVLVALVARGAWRRASVRLEAADRLAAPGGRSRFADQLARSGVPVAAVTGVRMALAPSSPSGRGRATPARGAIVGLVVAVAAVAAAATFGANLTRVVSTPGLYGQAWDAAVDVQFGTFTPGQFAQLTAGVPGIAGVTFGTHSSVQVGQELVPAIGLAPGGRGALMSATLLSGRAPGNAGEIVLGATVLRQAGLHVGQLVAVTLDGGGRRDLRIVGSAVFPFFGQGSFTPTDVGLGAEASASLLPAEIATPGGPPGTAYNFALVRFAPGAGRAAAVAGFTRALDAYCAQVQQSTCVVTDQRPNTVANYASIDATPAVLSGLLAVLGLGMLAQFILTSGTRARRDTAVLKVCGMLRRQVIAVTCWQASVVVTAALAVGLPLGIAGGHWAWAAFAIAAGLPAGALTPLPVLWMIPAAVVAANLIAARPALAAARSRPAIVLRAE
jgi:hypothetical protein